MQTLRKRISKKAVAELAKQLADVRDSFGWYGIEEAEEQRATEGHDVVVVEPPQPAPEAVQEIEADDDDDVWEPEDDTYPEPNYDPWDVQSALDEAMSNVVKSGLIPELKALKEAPSFSSVCAVLFGEDSEITEQAGYFEDLISGYMDRVLKSDLHEAYDVLDSILKQLGYRD